MFASVCSIFSSIHLTFTCHLLSVLRKPSRWHNHPIIIPTSMSKTLSSSCPLVVCCTPVTDYKALPLSSLLNCNLGTRYQQALGTKKMKHRYQQPLRGKSSSLVANCYATPPVASNCVPLPTCAERLQWGV